MVQLRSCNCIPFTVTTGIGVTVFWCFTTVLCIIKIQVFDILLVEIGQSGFLSGVFTIFGGVPHGVPPIGVMQPGFTTMFLPPGDNVVGCGELLLPLLPPDAIIKGITNSVVELFLFIASA
jgi:hypothetical protein